MSMVQRVAQIFGWGFVVIAISGFIASGGSMEADPAVAPKALGLFPVNLLHNLVHLAFGIWGIVAARSLSGARSYALIAGAIYLVLAILGLFMPTTLGLIPIGGNDIWLHALIAVVLLGAWAAARSATASPADTTRPASTGPDTAAGPTTTTGRGTTPGTTGPGTSGPGTTGPGTTGPGTTGTGTPPSSTPSSGTTPPGTTSPGSTAPGTTPPPSQDRPATPPPPPHGEGDRRP